jgi:hypothetical protein
MPQFRTKARAVELLGKGQIADLPTAITELWKNGYDAYGDKLVAFLYLAGYENYQAPVFVLSDDGKGMNAEDIINNWFVLGTDSKSRPGLDKKGAETLNKEPRVKMGEKGIGRLAVAYLGPQMLMLTKKVNHPLEIVFFDWRILENFNLFLSDINIPQKTLASLDHFHELFLELKSEFLQNFSLSSANASDPWADQLELRDTIIADCNALTIPSYIIEDRISHFFLNERKSSGTEFIIFKPEVQLVELRNFVKPSDQNIQDESSDKYVISTLAGLFNQFKEDQQVDKTHFWIYENNDEGRYDLLKYREFFNSGDFERCDHLIQGYFNELGEFNGSVRIYNKIVEHHFVPQTKRRNTTYGPFGLKVGYVQPLNDETKLSPEEKRVFEDKLSLYGGIFIMEVFLSIGMASVSFHMEGLTLIC